MFMAQDFTQEPRCRFQSISSGRILKIVNLISKARFYHLLGIVVLFTHTLPLAENVDLDVPTNQTDSTSPSESGYDLYPNISQQQSDLAHQVLRHAYSGNPKRATKTLDRMQKIEEVNKLPPLSALLNIAINVMRYQNGDFEDEEEEKAIHLTIEQAAEQGSYLCQAALKLEPNHPTYLLIDGGIKGFLATLKIHQNPSQALSDGFQALKLLERARKQDQRVRDSYMGTGIFNCTAANAPLFVRATLKIIGRSVSMKPGLDGLRISAYQGQYTSVASQLFLIQFLSPYGEELKREKREIFKSLETTFPKNAYYTFLKSDEALSFYPDSFYTTANRHILASRILTFGTQDYASRRYSNLVRYQYTLLNPNPEKRLAPDSTFAFRDFAFYPVFIEALRSKRITEDTLGLGEKPSVSSLASLKAYKDSCISLIKESPMNPSRKRYYQWHVTDALRWTSQNDRKLPTRVTTTLP
jgi:hypothetical protein